MNTRSFLSATALALATAITLNACSSDDSSDNNNSSGDKYAYCVFAEQQACIASTASCVENGGMLGNTCPADYSKPSSSSGGGTGGVSSSSGEGGTAGGKYIITGSGTVFTATKGGATVGEAGQPIKTVIDAIKTDANGSNVAIQFGDGTSVLDVGTQMAFRDGWGDITFSGKVTSANNSSVISVNNTNGIVINSTAEVTNTSSGGCISIEGGIRMAINGGKVLSNGSYAISAHSNSTITVNDGIIVGYIGNNGSGPNSNITIIINGGTIESQSDFVIMGTVVNITGGTISGKRTDGGYTVFSSNLTISNGTIKSNGSGSVAVGGGGTISGGTIENSKGTAIGSGGMTISGGIISSAANKTSTITNEDCTINNKGVLIISGGTVKNTGSGYSICNGNANGVGGGTVTIGADATIIGDTRGVN